MEIRVTFLFNSNLTKITYHILCYRNKATTAEKRILYFIKVSKLQIDSSKLLHKSLKKKRKKKAV